MIRVERFQISNFWGSKNITLDFKSKFIILTGHNGSGKSTILELLHDSFSLIHNGDVETMHESWATELNFDDKTLVRSYILGDEIDLSNDLKKKIENSAKNSMKFDVFKSFDAVNTTIKNHIKKKNKELVVKKDSSSASVKMAFLTMQYNPAKDAIILPNTIFFKDDRVFYNNVSDDVKEVKDLDIFIKEDSINKTLYLLMSSFILQESKSKKRNFTDKDKIKKEIMEELQSDPIFLEGLDLADEMLLSKIEGLVERLVIRKNKENSWGNELFASINGFLNKTGRDVTRDEKGFIAIKLKSGKVIKWFNFSRGEKTLFVLLLSVFLNKNENVIFILDEPDLSLHIEWQELLLPTLSRLAPERQFILSTHSPALIGNVDEQYLNIAAITE